MATLNDTLSAVEKQVREKREKFGETWELPGNDPVSQEIIGIVAAEESDGNALE